MQDTRALAPPGKQSNRFTLPCWSLLSGSSLKAQGVPPPERGQDLDSEMPLKQGEGAGPADFVTKPLRPIREGKMMTEQSPNHGWSV